MRTALTRCGVLCPQLLSYFTIAWLPLASCLHRIAAVFVPVMMALSRPKLTQHTSLWLFVVWAVISLWWAPDPARAWHVAGCVALFLLVRPTRVWSVPLQFIHLAVLVSVVAQTLLVWLGIGHKNVALLYAPVALTLSLLCAVYPSWFMIFCSLWVGWVVDCDTALLTTVGVVVARYMPFIWLKHVWKALWITVGLGLLGIYHLSDKQIQSFESLSPSFSHLHRIYIYREVGRLICAEPLNQQLRGFGLDASRVVGNKEFSFEASIGGKKRHISKIIPMHPHNIILQILLELGWVGIALFGFCLWRLPLRRKEEALVLYVAACHALVSVGVWQTWWMASVWLAYWLARMRCLDDV